MILLLIPSLAAAQDWQLVWSDEFDADSLDQSNWEYMYGTGSQYGIPGWGNSELQYYTDRKENIYIEDNKLHIRAKEESFATRSYTSARIRSKNKADFLYGKIEARAKLPKGRGLWPAIWMMPTDSEYGGWPRSGEIDIMEMKGDQPDLVYGTVHYGSGPGAGHALTEGRYTLPDGTFHDDFHTFTIIWEPDRIEWYVNDNWYHFVTPAHLNPHPWVFDKKFHLLLNVAVGGNFLDNPDETTEFPQEMIIDYIRVYQDAELTSSENIENELPSSFELHQNHPNPFNPETTVSFTLPEDSDVTLKVYNSLGQEVAVLANEQKSAGVHSFTFDASGLSSGTYIYRLRAGDYVTSRQMMLVK